ncbi:hypothetical protein ACPPVU_15745 [Mucilaginibacter sp. McL0603]|uniref:hypothetical protein n=1 Tax=Mucilaginibacter sp. McL0603 TaxID=3415670 RepID=UPI003CEA3123
MRNRSFEDSAYRQRFGFRKKFILIPFLAVGALFLITYIVMLLWNNLLPDILHASTITYWQAMGVLVLSKILFGFGGRGRGGSPWMHKIERFKNMSPEEQQRFREEMRSRCGKWGRNRGGFDWDRPAENTEKPAEDTSKPVE